MHRSLHLLSNMAAAIVDAAVIAVAAGASVSVYTQRIEIGMQAMFVSLCDCGRCLELPRLANKSGRADDVL